MTSASILGTGKIGNFEGGIYMNIGFWLCGVLVIPFSIIGVLFFKNVHFDTYKAFKKYLLK